MKHFWVLHLLDNLPCRANARLREHAHSQSSSCNKAREKAKVSRAPSTASGPPSSRSNIIKLKKDQVQNKWLGSFLQKN